MSSFYSQMDLEHVVVVAVVVLLLLHITVGMRSHTRRFG